MISGLGTFLGLWGFLGSVGTSLDEVFWVPAKNRSTVRFLRVLDMRRMNVNVHKNRAMSRRSGQRRDVRANVATFRPMSRRSRELYCQHRDVEIQRHDVPKGESFNVAALGSNVATFRRVT